MKLIPKLLLSTTPSHRNQLLDEVESLTKEPKTILRSSVGILSFFLKRFINNQEYKNDTAELWASDLAEMGILDENQHGAFISIVGSILDNVVPEISDDMRKKEFESGIFPTLVGMGSTVEIRAFNPVRYKPTLDVNKYVPKIEGYVPVASVKLTCESRAEKEIFFQATKSDLILLMNFIQATVKDLEALQENLIPNE